MSPRPKLDIAVLFTLSKCKMRKILLKSKMLTNLWPVRVGKIVTVNLDSQHL